MKLKQALVLGLTTAVLAIPALAADEATKAASLPSSVKADQKAAVTTPAKKETFHKKGLKSLLGNNSTATKKMSKQADLNLNNVNPNGPAKN